MTTSRHQTTKSLIIQQHINDYNTTVLSILTSINDYSTTVLSILTSNRPSTCTGPFLCKIFWTRWMLLFLFREIQTQSHRHRSTRKPQLLLVNAVRHHKTLFRQSLGSNFGTYRLCHGTLCGCSVMLYRNPTSIHFGLFYYGRIHHHNYYHRPTHWQWYLRKFDPYRVL